MAGCCSVVMWLCFDGFAGSCYEGSLICCCVLEDGLVIGLFLLVVGPVMGISWCSDVLGMALPQCMDGVGKGVVSMLMGWMCCLLQQ